MVVFGSNRPSLIPWMLASIATKQGTPEESQ
jgi:hypothetical protein